MSDMMILPGVVQTTAMLLLSQHTQSARSVAFNLENPPRFGGLSAMFACV